jgi:hypothetical protein
MENLTDIGQPVFTLVKVYHLDESMISFGVFKDQGEQTIIGSNKEVPAKMKPNRTPLGTYTGIDNCNMDGAGWKEWRSTSQCKGSLLDVLRLDRMADIGNLNLRGNLPDYSFHNAWITIV